MAIDAFHSKINKEYQIELISFNLKIHTRLLEKYEEVQANT